MALDDDKNVGGDYNDVKLLACAMLCCAALLASEPLAMMGTSVTLTIDALSYFCVFLYVFLGFVEQSRNVVLFRWK